MKDLITIREGVEFITLQLIEKIERLRKEYAQVAIGVYTDELFEKVFGRAPIKPFEERVRLANSLKGVDWVFKASNQHEAEEVCVQLYKNTIGPHMYHIGYVPGTYDLFHEGHLQHLLICRGFCDILVVGVNGDLFVLNTKGVETHDNQDYRVRVVQNLKFVDMVILVDTNDKSVINQQVMERVGEPIDVIFLGSDLKGKDHDAHGIKVVFTDRDEEFMKTHSSTYLRDIVANFLGENAE